MAFFKFRWPSQRDSQAEKPAKRSRAAQTESIDAMRRRARHRLIGAAVLVAAGVIGFPMLFDTQPRPIPVDIPIEIPDRNKVAPLVVPAPVSAQANEGVPARSPRSEAAEGGFRAGSGIADGEELLPSEPAPRPAPAPAPVAPAKQITAAPVAPIAPPVAKPAVAPPAAPAASKPAPVPKSETRPDAPRTAASASADARVARADDAARARALLEGRSLEARPAVAEEGRLVVQVGAFADADKAREVRSKLERSGLKTYTQVVDTKDGKRTRVRVGPFASRAEADRAASRIKSMDLSASVLSL